MSNINTREPPVGECRHLVEMNELQRRTCRKQTGRPEPRSVSGPAPTNHSAVKNLVGSFQFRLQGVKVSLYLSLESELSLDVADGT